MDELIGAFILAIIYFIVFFGPFLLPLALAIGVFKLVTNGHAPAPTKPTSTRRPPASTKSLNELQILLGVVVAVISLLVYGLIDCQKRNY
jgi:hypothetical protein